MEFDRESLQPLYKLKIGEAGESCALYIAQRLGFPSHMLARAEKEAYNKASVVKEHSSIIIKEEKKENTVSTNKIKPEIIKTTKPLHGESFNVGDSVKVFPQKDIGIIYKTIDEKGNLIVQIKGKKQAINHKRIKLITPASQLYPDDYDFSIIFDTVENRKARHDMGRKYDPSLEVKCEDEI
ncbi:Endonuclease MutS2 [bioreactor metagenome]|uniref:Endonuclease MutS2 n=1 Tax=bioreactor metagenome TaxID=1076179 RepID=A0A645FFG3_9ZZZZ